MPLSLAAQRLSLDAPHSAAHTPKMARKAAAVSQHTVAGKRETNEVTYTVLAFKHVF